MEIDKMNQGMAIQMRIGELMSYKENLLKAKNVSTVKVSYGQGNLKFGNDVELKYCNTDELIVYNVNAADREIAKLQKDFKKL